MIDNGYVLSLSHLGTKYHPCGDYKILYILWICVCEVILLFMQIFLHGCPRGTAAAATKAFAGLVGATSPLETSLFSMQPVQYGCCQ